MINFARRTEQVVLISDNSSAPITVDGAHRQSAWFRDIKSSTTGFQTAPTHRPDMISLPKPNPIFRIQKLVVLQAAGHDRPAGRLQTLPCTSLRPLKGATSVSVGRRADKEFSHTEQSRITPSKLAVSTCKFNFTHTNDTHSIKPNISHLQIQNRHFEIHIPA